MVRAKDCHDILDQLKPVYQATTQEEAENKLNAFREAIMKNYPKVNKLINDNQSLFSFLQFPAKIQQSLYTTNLIESFNKHLMR